MKVLLDTNIIIHRENNRCVTNENIGQLFKWLDNLHCEKMVHPLTIQEIRQYKDPVTQQLFNVKLDSYNVIKSVVEPTPEFLGHLANFPELSGNDRIDNTLLFYVCDGRVDLLITEDRKIKEKAKALQAENRVLSVAEFINQAKSESVTLASYEVLDVKKVLFGDVDLSDPFFDSFREDYEGFDDWFKRKSEEEAYIYRENGQIVGFLYLKREEENEPYNDINPVFSRKCRLKVGTFKVVSSGFRLGERFIKIICDNAIDNHVQEVYITLFSDRPELRRLKKLLEDWGFKKYGVKGNGARKEEVLVKPIGGYDHSLTPTANYPNIRYGVKKLFMPILAKYHTHMFPDSILKNEDIADFNKRDAHKYALKKVYVSWSPYNEGVAPGDLALIYRMGTHNGRKGYESVLTTLTMIDSVSDGFKTREDFLRACQDRSVFSSAELESFWSGYSWKLKVVRLIYLKSLSSRLTLGYMWDNGIAPHKGGVRQFDSMSDEQFNMIMRDSETDFAFCDRR